MKKEKILDVIKFVTLLFLLVLLILLSCGLVFCINQEKEEQKIREDIAVYDVIISGTLKEHFVEYESIDYSRIRSRNEILIYCGNLNLEYEKIYEVIQAFDIFPDVILVSYSGDTYKTDELELLKNDETVWEKEIPDSEQDIYRRYFEEGKCSYYDGKCEYEPYEDKYYCISHCCFEDGCNLFSDPVVSFCKIHSCIYPGCGEPRSLRYHGDGDYCRIHKDKSWEKYITDERRYDFG